MFKALTHDRAAKGTELGAAYTLEGVAVTLMAGAAENCGRKRGGGRSRRYRGQTFGDGRKSDSA